MRGWELRAGLLPWSVCGPRHGGVPPTVTPHPLLGVCAVMLSRGRSHPSLRSGFLPAPQLCRGVRAVGWPWGPPRADPTPRGVLHGVCGRRAPWARPGTEGVFVGRFRTEKLLPAQAQGAPLSHLHVPSTLTGPTDLLNNLRCIEMIITQTSAMI